VQQACSRILGGSASRRSRAPRGGRELGQARAPRGASSSERISSGTLCARGRGFASAAGVGVSGASPAKRAGPPRPRSPRPRGCPPSRPTKALPPKAVDVRTACKPSSSADRRVEVAAARRRSTSTSGLLRAAPEPPRRAGIGLRTRRVARDHQVGPSGSSNCDRVECGCPASYAPRRDPARFRASGSRRRPSAPRRAQIASREAFAHLPSPRTAAARLLPSAPAQASPTPSSDPRRPRPIRERLVQLGLGAHAPFAGVAARPSNKPVQQARPVAPPRGGPAS